MSDKKRLILHIGRAKSGTSTLQTFLTLHRNELLARGICYPKAGSDGAPAHHALAIACRDAPAQSAELAEMRAAFESEIAPFQTVILSSEAFQNVRQPANLGFFFRRSQSGLSRVLPKPLRAGHYRVDVICYIREFLEFASSSYAQKVHANDYADTLEGYCRTHFRRPLVSLIELWRRFADEAKFLCYDRKRLVNGDIVEDFFHQAGLSPPAPTSTQDANPSISGNLLAFKLLLNQHNGHDPALYGVLTELARLDPRYRGKIYIGNAQAAALRALDRGYNTQLSSLVGEIEYRSFEGGNGFDAGLWADDLARFLDHPALAFLKERPEICGASAETAAALVGR